MKKIIFLFALSIISMDIFAEPKLPALFIDAETNHLKNIRDIAISPAGVIWFTHQHPEMKFSVIYSLSKDGVLKKASFSGDHLDMELCFKPNSNLIYFVSDRPHAYNDGKIKNFDIWCFEQNFNGDTIRLVHPEAPFNTSANEFYPSFTNDGDLYFTSDMEGTKGADDIFYCKFENGTYSKPISLSDSINTDGAEYNAFVAPDCSYIIFGAYKRADGFGSGDLYISYSLPNGEWTKAKNLGTKVNSAAMDYCPFVDKNAVLYFTSKRGILELKSEKEQLKESKKFPGGRSRLYSIASRDWLPVE